jgi:hypothetical protein
MSEETIRCVNCGRTFVWNYGEQHYFKEHGLTAPRRYPTCRAHKRFAREPGMRAFSGPPTEFAVASSATQIQADFDRIALLSTDAWDHNSHYHSFLLKHVPSPRAEALDIGCGTGSFARLLAQRCKRVLAHMPSSKPWNPHFALFARRAFTAPVVAAARQDGTHLVTFAKMVSDLGATPRRAI